MKEENKTYPIPEEWEISLLKEKFMFTSKPRGLRFEDFKNIPFIPMDYLPVNRLFVSKYNLKEPENISSGTYFEEGDLLLSKITPCFENGKQGIAKDIPGGFGIATTEIIPIKEVEGISHLPFLAMYLLENNTRNTIAGRMEGATGRQRLAKSTLENWLIPVPPLQEQKAIAAILSKIQAAMELQEKIISKLKKLKSAAMAKLFREGLHGEPLKQTEIDGIPQSWEVLPLGSLLELAQYGLSIRGTKNGRYPILRMNCQQDGQVIFRDLQYVDVSNDVLNTFKLHNGDILFNRTNSFELVGRTAMFHGTQEAVFASYLIRLQSDKTMLIPDFLNYYLNFESTQTALKSLATRGVSQSNISASKLKLFMIPLPSIDEQNQIVQILDQISNLTIMNIRKLDNLKSLFSSMLHLLMTGQLRVNQLKI